MSTFEGVATLVIPAKAGNYYGLFGFVAGNAFPMQSLLFGLLAVMQIHGC